MKPLYIFDLDGTLVLIQHRKHYIEDKDDSQRCANGVACFQVAPGEF